MIKSTITNKPKQEPEMKFPILMIHEDDLDRPDPLIVLFVSKQSGFIVHHNDHCCYDLYTFRNNWRFEYYVPFNGTIELKNEE